MFNLSTRYKSSNGQDALRIAQLEAGLDRAVSRSEIATCIGYKYPFTGAANRVRDIRSIHNRRVLGKRLSVVIFADNAGKMNAIRARR
jgi:hypothetical protein